MNVKRHSQWRLKECHKQTGFKRNGKESSSGREMTPEKNLELQEWKTEMVKYLGKHNKLFFP